MSKTIPAPVTNQITMIKKYIFTSDIPGPTVLFFGAIHGNEACGQKALKKLINDLSSKTTCLEKGRVIVVPIANPTAFKEGTRYVNKNLNRVFKVTETPRTYEEKLANTLCVLISESDFLLDIHSFHTAGKPFVFLDHSSQVEYGKALGVKDGISGWPELYENQEQHSDTVKYALSLGKKALLIECGSHKSPGSVVVAYNAANNLLGFLGMVAVEPNLILNFNNVEMKEIFTLKDVSDRLSKKWKHLDPIKQGDLLAHCKEGPILAQYDGFILLPNHNALVNDEWFYLGK